MHISGESAIDRTVLVNVNNVITDVGDITVACFDYVQDGVIDDKDKTAWQQWINKNKNDSDFNIFADLNGDGYINAKDFALFNRFKGKSKNNIYTNI